MKPKTAVITIIIFGILIIITAYLQRGEFGVGPEGTAGDCSGYSTVKERRKRNS